MRYLAVAASLAAILACANAARASADTPLKPVVVRAKLDGTTAKVTARFALSIGGAATHRTMRISIPARGIVTGATALAGGVTHRLSLVPADEAAARFDALVVAPPATDRWWAIKIDSGRTSQWSPSVVIDVAAPRTAPFELDLEIDVPTCFDRDVRYAAVPEDWRSALDPKSHRDDKSIPCLVEAKAWLAFASRELAIRPAGDQRIGGITARLPLTERDLARVEIDLAREISDVPADLYTAIVIDGSRSLTGYEVEVQRAIVESYLHKAPHSHIQVIAYARGARSLLPDWTLASQALPRITRELQALEGRNGSSVDVGIREAAKWLASVKGTRRIVVFSDERLAQRLLDIPPTALGSGLPEATVIHVVTLTNYSGPLIRADDAKLAALAKATEGIAVHGGLDAQDLADATMLVRPVSLDAIEINAPGWQSLNEVFDPCELVDGVKIAEGTGCTWQGHGTASSGPITIEGLLWNRRFSRILQPDPARALELARGLSAAGTLEPALEHEVDGVARAVNATWSLDAAWGGTGGYADRERVAPDTYGYGKDSCICDGGAGTRGFGSVGARPDRGTVHDQIAGSVASCHPGSAAVTVTIETTLQEIVDVRVNAPAAVHDCLVEAVWNTMLVFPNAPEHATIALAFTP